MTSSWTDSNGQCTSPIAEAISVALRAFHGSGKIGCRRTGETTPFRVFSYREDFEYLWQFDGSLLGSLGTSCRTIVLIWDETPFDENDESMRLINIRDHVTAFDWAVSLGLKMLDTTATQSAAKGQIASFFAWRVIILDCASQHHPGSETTQLFQRLQHGTDSFLPWIQVLHPNNLDELVTLLQANQPQAVARGDLDLARRLWSSSLVRPSDARDRHAIANLIGPQILLSGMKDSRISPAGSQGQPQNTTPSADSHFRCNLREALRAHMQAIGLVPDLADREDTPWVAPSEWRELVNTFVLVDDMHKLGWTEFLAAALGIPANTSVLRSVDNPHFNGLGPHGMSRLVGLPPQHNVGTSTESVSQPNSGYVDLLVDGNGDLRLNQGLCLTGKAKEVLFLDLRLFTARPDDEFTFFERLVKLAEQAKEGANDLRWPGFSQEEIDAVHECVRSRTTEDENYYTSLTLLPRLISLVDPYLPIVLFSSTGQKRIVDRLSRYGTISLDFDKPRFFADPSANIVSETKARFVRAMNHALRIARGRHLRATIIALPAVTNAIAYTSANPVLEIYIDESGDGTDNYPLTLGGLAILYPNAQTPTMLGKQLWANGIVWGWDRDQLWTQPPHTLPKSTTCDLSLLQSKMNDIHNLATSLNVQITSFALRGRPVDLPVLQWASPDHLFRLLLKDALELLLFEWLPATCQANKMDVAIYPGTRMIRATGSELLRLSRNFGMELLPQGGTERGVTEIRDVTSIQNAMKIANLKNVAFRMHWGELRMYVEDSSVEDSSGKLVTISASVNPRQCRELLAYSFRYDDVHVLLAEVIASRPSHKLNINLTAAEAVRLTYPHMQLDVTPHQLPRQIHYAADWVVGRWDCVPKKWKDTGFFEYRDVSFSHMVQSCRHAGSVGNESSEALLEWYRGQDVAESYIGQRATVRASSSSKTLSGKEFCDLCDTLDVIHREREKRLIFVGNIPHNTIADQVRKWFIGYGLAGVSLRKNHAVLEFTDIAETKRILELSKLRKLGRVPPHLSIHPYQSR